MMRSVALLAAALAAWDGDATIGGILAKIRQDSGADSFVRGGVVAIDKTCNKAADQP